jgi:glycine dehydrogenase
MCSSSIATLIRRLAVLETRARGFGFDLVVGDPEKDLKPDTVFAALLSYPGSSGQVRDYRAIIASLKQAGAMSIMATDLLSLCLLVPPGELGADVAIGSAQRFRRADGLWRTACRLLCHP